MVALEDAPALQGCISETGDTLPSGSTKVICCWAGEVIAPGNRREDGCFAALKEMGQYLVSEKPCGGLLGSPGLYHGR